MTLQQSTRLHFGSLDNAEELNRALLEGFARWAEHPETRRTHYFGARYENVYIGADRIPALTGLLIAARRLAGEALGVPADTLRAGFWFNAMGPGTRTLPHTHDDADEILSGVYYVEVPPDSGDLVIHDRHARTIVTPRAGMLVLFPPDLPHEVSENRSGRERLSIGMNFGVDTPADAP
jgi:hypothetical protein